MTKLRFLGAAVVLSSALASPVMAQRLISNHSYCAKFYCQNKGHPYTGDYQRRGAFNNSYNRWDGDQGRVLASPPSSAPLSSLLIPGAP